MKTIKIFLASSSELADDRKEFEILINRKNKEYVESEVFFKLVLWEDFLDAMSPTRLQDEYNKAVAECDIFVSLFHTKVGKFSEEEFLKAQATFKANGKPLIYTYFKDAAIKMSQITPEIQTLLNFRQKLRDLGHFPTNYAHIPELKYQFNEQLIKITKSLKCKINRQTIESPSEDPIQNWLESPPEIPWPFADNFSLRDAFETMLTRASPYRVLLVNGESERGKTIATKQLLSSAIALEWLRCGRLEFKGTNELEGEIPPFVLHLRVSEPKKGKLLRRLKQVFNDLNMQKRPTLLIFDAYETCDSRTGYWLENVVLVETARADWLRVIIAGQKTPKKTEYLPWEPYSCSIHLDQPTCEDWIEFVRRLQKKVKIELLRMAYEHKEGSPRFMNDLCSARKA